MTHCDFGVSSAPEVMRHIIGSSEPDAIIGSDKDQDRRCKKKDKDHMESLCELYEGLTCEGHTSALHHEEESSSNCRQKITMQGMNTRAGCCNAACTARATLRKIGKRLCIDTQRPQVS